MILGFLGKGGSGKSSVATQMALWLNQKNKNVLAIDADHNMDLSFNLSGGEVSEIPYFSDSLDVLAQAVGLTKEQKYSEAFSNSTEFRFLLSPLSPEIEKFSKLLSSKMRLMAAGPQTDIVLFGKSCNHNLSTPLKLLLPLLELKNDEVAVVDEKAGADGVTTGIVSGIDVGVIVCEPSLHSLKTAKQIAELMNFYNTPYIFVGNKISSSEDRNFIVKELGEEPTAFLLTSEYMKREPGSVASEWQDELQTIFQAAESLSKDNRLERTILKFKRNQEFAHKDHS